MAQRPNIVFLLTDDQRWDAMGCAGNPIIQTPELDRLARDGTRFTQAFVNTPICCVSRASFFTGQYEASHGIQDFGTNFTPEQWQETYPVRLRASGYYTGFTGKWGVGNDLRKEDFDWHKGFGGQGLFFPDKENPERHLTAVLAEQAEGFIAGAPDDRPFCLSLSFKAPHVQDQDPRQFLYDPALEDLYADIELPPPPKSDPSYFDDLPEFTKRSEGRVRWHRRFETPERYQQMVKGYYRLVTGVDRAIGRIRAALEARGVADNTVILFTSDHGFYLGERGLAGKWLMHEESLRVPMLAYDPRIPARDRAPIRPEMMSTLDIPRTILSLAELDAPGFLQGRDLRPLLTHGAVPWRNEVYYEHHFGETRDPVIPASEGVRDGRWKYIRYRHGEPRFEELYDLNLDPFETMNLAGDATHAGELERMRGRWESWQAAFGAWRAEPDYTWADPA